MCRFPWFDLLSKKDPTLFFCFVPSMETPSSSSAPVPSPSSSLSRRGNARLNLGTVTRAQVNALRLLAATLLGRSAPRTDASAPRTASRTGRELSVVLTGRSSDPLAGCVAAFHPNSMRLTNHALHSALLWIRGFFLALSLCGSQTSSKCAPRCVAPGTNLFTVSPHSSLLTVQ